MKNYNAAKDYVVRKIPMPALMLCAHLGNGEKPDILIPIGNDIWVCEFNEFFDAGLDENATIIPVDGRSFKGSASVIRDARMAWEYFYKGADSGEYGESMMPFEEQHRRMHFAAIYEGVTGKKMIFKEVA